MNDRVSRRAVLVAAGVYSLVGSACTVPTTRTHSVTGAPDPAAAASFSVGDRVSCRWRNGKTAYEGRVASIVGGRLHINYDDGDVEEVTPSLCTRIDGGGGEAATLPAAPSLPAAPPPGASCVSDADCAGAEVCVDGACRATSDGDLM